MQHSGRAMIIEECRRARHMAEQRAQRNALRKPMQRQLEQTEQSLARTEARIAEIDARLAEPDAYQDAPVAAELARERGQRIRERDTLEEAWLEQSSRLEALDGEPAG
jgi:ATP-binding cassette subfamily F protein 3